MRGMDEEAKSREGELDDAFKDLNALMAKAKEMASFLPYSLATFCQFTTY